MIVPRWEFGIVFPCMCRGFSSYFPEHNPYYPVHLTETIFPILPFPKDELSLFEGVDKIIGIL